MTHLRFPSEAAVRAVLPLVPPSVLARGGTVRREAGGALSLRVPDLPAEVVRALDRAGLTDARSEVSGANDRGVPFSHWAELVRPEPDADPDLRQVVFEVGPDEGWLPLVAELVRLGADDVRLAGLLDGGWLIWVQRPPFYTVAKAQDGTWTAFARQGARGVWVEVGWRHPYASALVAPDDGLVSIDRAGRWRVLVVEEWTELSSHLELTLPAPERVGVSPPTEVLSVRLRLVPAASRAQPSLWVLPPPVDEGLARLVGRLPDTIVSRLALARFTLADGAPGAALRSRPGHPPPVLEGLEPYVVHPHLRGLYLPHGTAIDPALQATTLRRVLHPGSGQLGWLAPVGERSGFVLRTIADEAFRPLAEHLLYVAERDAEAVEAWAASTRFDWEPLDLPVREAPSRSMAPEVVEPVERAPSPRHRPAAPTARSVPQARRPPVALPPAELELLEPTEAEIELQRLQEAYRLDPERDDLWASMADLHHALGQPREAALCWARALWHTPPAHLAEMAQAWASRVPLPDELGANPTSAELCAVGAHVLAGHEVADAPALQRWLDDHDAVLDVRLRWLARRAVAARAGHDVLALARARDTLLSAMRTGLVPSRDVPAFLRTTLTPEGVRLLTQSLRALAEHVPGLAPAVAHPASSVYAQLTIAWGQAMLGQIPVAHAALERASSELPGDDDIHRTLFELYRASILHALRGLPPGTPPPSRVREALARLSKLDRYKINRLRDHSVGVIAVPGGIDPFASFVDGQETSLLALPGEQLLVEIRDRLARLEDPGRGRIAEDLLKILQSVPSLGAGDASAVGVLVEVLGRAVERPAPERVPVLVEAIGVAAALRAPGRVEGVLGPLRTGLADLLQADPRAAVAHIDLAARFLVRCGLSDRARPVFEGLREDCPSDAVVPGLRISAAVARLGGTVQGETERAIASLEGELQDVERAAIMVAAPDLAAPLALPDAVVYWSRLAGHTAALSDRYSTNTHFALSFLQAVDAIVAAHVHPDRLLGPDGRVRLEVEEHEIRGRIHQEDRF